MSFVSKVVLASCCIASVGIIGYVHYKQQYDRDQLRQGVIRDIERQQRQKIQNIYELRQQEELTKKLRKQEMNTETT
ncbi:protein PET117 homolog, mitochondrial [Cephus cinctus]|uniref:Protein PET117 homolog, mitochondrial n=1 Tax=Cephus cinctus TaxID=211228 RepID=A0AAJ7BJF6_CEPCN|nr:protein PET117 homolog, mitochondrial [Cephus cinctus]